MSRIIFVVEDHDDLRAEVAEVLKTDQYTVFTAANGRDALDTLARREWRPDLIVSDIAMPRMDGYEFFMAVHADPELRTIPFIFLTARGTRRDVHIGRQLGVDDYLVKPFEPEELLTAVHNKLQRTIDMQEDADRKLDEARRQVVQLISHELRTPLTYVTGGFSLLADDMNQAMTPDVAISLDLIRNGTNRLNRLAEQMVLYTELISGHVRLQLEAAGAPIELEQWLTMTLTVQQELASERNVTLRLGTLPNESLHVFGLLDLLTTALGEVLRNAIAYSPEGGEVGVFVTRTSDGVTVQVVDHGRGIVPDDLDKIWDVLIQSERHTHEQQGAGMGLPIAYHVFNAHSGDIRLESVVNQGTTVTIRLPLH